MTLLERCSETQQGVVAMRLASCLVAVCEADYYYFFSLLIISLNLSIILTSVRLQKMSQKPFEGVKRAGMNFFQE